MAISEGTIHAKVSGSRPQPYQVSIKVPLLSQKQVNLLLDELVADLGVIACLLNRELDPSVLELAKRLGISIIPSKWKDLMMTCSCPDWAIPCKHMAATIYLVSREIDSNPFLVFSIKVVDLAVELAARGINIDA